MVTRRDPQGARRRILTAARGEFAATGVAGARVERIAAVAGVNKRMLYHYFGDKAGLWQAVLAAAVAAPLAGRETARLLLWAALEARAPDELVELRRRLAAAAVSLAHSGEAEIELWGLLLRQALGERRTGSPPAAPPGRKPRIRLKGRADDG